MIFCYTLRKVPCPVFIREVSYSNCKDPDRHYVESMPKRGACIGVLPSELRKSHGRGNRKVIELKDKENILFPVLSTYQESSSATLPFHW